MSLMTHNPSFAISPNKQDVVELCAHLVSRRSFEDLKIKEEKRNYLLCTYQPNRRECEHS